MQAADYNKEGRVDKAHMLGSAAFIYDLIIVVIYIVCYAVGIFCTVVTVFALVFGS